MLYKLFYQIPLFIIQFASSLVNMIFPSYAAGTKCPICEKISQYLSRCLNICFWVNKQKVSRPFREMPHVKFFSIMWHCLLFIEHGVMRVRGCARQAWRSSKVRCVIITMTVWGTDNAAFRADCRWVRSHVYERDLVNRKQKILVEAKQTTCNGLDQAQ